MCFPLAGRWKFDDGLTFLYAPRSDDELEVIFRIMDAGIKFMLPKVKA